MSFKNETVAQMELSAVDTGNLAPDQVLKWVRSNPSLHDLSAQYPDHYNSIRQELAEILATGTAHELPVYLKQMIESERRLEKQYAGSRSSEKLARALMQQAIRTRMAHLAIKQHLIAEATGVEKGKIRFNLLNGFLAQKLLFADGLERKPVSLFWFRVVWPLVRQKKLLMPLVQAEGIYCFYSRQLINELATLAGSRNCLEIAAGDGTLSRFLAGSGVRITATDDYSWKHEVTYSESVVKRGAAEALREYAPEVVICSWPPAGNSFEQQVFRTKSVQLYIVIASRHRFAAGNWHEYSRQTAFDCTLDERLSSLVLPPELDAALYLFRRKTSEEGAGK